MTEDRVENLRFNILRNAMYHTARRRFYEGWNRWFNFAVVLLGAAAMGDALNTFGIQQVYIGVAVAVVGAGQLVFDFGRQARDHQALQRDYYNLLADIDECTGPTDEKCAMWAAKMTRIAGDEPPVYRALDAKAYNDAIGAMEWDQSEMIHIPWYQRLAGGFLPFDGYAYKKVSELHGARQLPSP